jgi:hypothetical protein
MPVRSPVYLTPLKIKVTGLDKQFIEHASRQLGIAQAEFVRRLIAVERMEWIKNGLYQFPGIQRQKGHGEGEREGLQ